MYHLGGEVNVFLKGLYLILEWMMDALSLAKQGSGCRVEKGKNIKDSAHCLKSSLESIAQSH